MERPLGIIENLIDAPLMYRAAIGVRTLPVSSLEVCPVPTSPIGYSVRCKKFYQLHAAEASLFSGATVVKLYYAITLRFHLSIELKWNIALVEGRKIERIISVCGRAACEIEMRRFKGFSRPLCRVLL